MTKPKFYDGTKILNTKDLDGLTPAIFMVSGNRTAGKTTFFNHYLMERFIKYGEKFLLLYRFKQDLENVSDNFFGNLKNLFYNQYSMSEQTYNKGSYTQLFLEGDVLEKSKVCGYAVALNSADSVKKVSHILNDSQHIFFDEFQSETGNYAQKEIVKFQSIYTSIARGNGKQFRHVPVYMCSNNVSVLNPYFTHFGVAERLRPDTKILRGHGWVLEIANNESAKESQQDSSFYRAFSDSEYMKYSSEGYYLNDNLSFIEKINNQGRYLVTIRTGSDYFGVTVHEDLGLFYCSDKADKDYPVRIAATIDDHTPNYVMLQQNKVLINTMREIFEKGAFRFKNLKCKNAILKTLAYY